MKAFTVRLPEGLVAQIEAEAGERNVSKSRVVRERLNLAPRRQTALLDAITDLIGSVDGLPADLSTRKLQAVGLRSAGPRRATRALR
jgi:Arc/MetJ-type ribon-helix-helix transcriptional regulator